MKLLFLVFFTIINTLIIKNASADEQTSVEAFSSRKPKTMPPIGVRPPQPKSPPDLVVAQDGSGNFRTIKEALDASLKRGDQKKRFFIYIKRGTYNEHIVVGDNMKNITLIGDGMGNTTITGSRSAKDGYQTHNAATVEVFGNGFVAHNITFQNTAGSLSHQAPAITSASSQSAFYHCSFEGYQDTIFAQSGRQFYRECNIYGTIDFICGDAAVIIQGSKIYTRKSSTSNMIVIGASQRESSNSPTGIVFHNCQFKAVPELKPALNSYKVYLGRPWGTFARTVYIENDFDIPVDPAGWLEWEGRPSSAPNNVYYGEYENRGMGSSTSQRVQWSGFRVITNPQEAKQFTVLNFIQGDKWLPRTGVPFTSGL